MFKFKFVAAVVASLFVSAAAVGCSSPEETGETSDEVGASTAPLARFNKHLQPLKSTIESGRPIEEVAQSLLSSGRPLAFSLQALCRVYSDVDPKFKEIRDDFKGLEDGIGAYAKWDDIYREGVSGGKDAATLERLKGERDKALVAFQKLLSDRQWITADGAPTRIKMTEDFLKAFNWRTRAEDRKRVLSQLIDEVEDAQKTKYDMTILEYGDGVHEIRRDLRWVLIEQLALNGMITLKEGADSCPVPAYANLANDNRYGALYPTATEPKPCQVSGCLVFALSKAVSSFGDIKDQAEIEVNLNGDSDVVPERLQAPAQALYDEMVKNDLLGQYAAQLQACKAAL